MFCHFQGINLISFFLGKVCVVHLCNFDWLVKKAWMLSHPTHLTSITQNCTSSRNSSLFYVLDRTSIEWYWMQWSATLFFTNLALSWSIQIFKCSLQTWITSLQLYCRIKCRQLPVITGLFLYIITKNQYVI